MQRGIPVILLLLLSAAASAADPVAEFNATSGISVSGWTPERDKEKPAEIAFEDGVLRIEDFEQDGKAEDGYFRFDLTDAQRATARLDGFVYEWTVRIPENTGGVTRAISTEVCVKAATPESLLRFGLSLGRRGSELVGGLYTGKDSGWQEGARIVTDPDEFHTWTLVFDGQSRVFNLLVDGHLALAAEMEHRDTGHDLVFGSRSTGTGISEWKSVRFSLGIGDTKLVTPAPLPDRNDVFTGGQDGYFAYRIPSLIVAPNGDLLVFCEARKANLSDDGDIDLLLKRSTDNGQTWSDQHLIYEEGGDAHIKYGNPTAVVDSQTATIWLAANRDYLTDRGQRAGGTLVFFRSTDNGHTWSAPIDITESIKRPDWGHYAFGPGIGIQVQRGPHRGRLVIPANYRLSFNKREPSYSHIIYSDDHGETWKLGGQLGDYTNECQVVEIVDGDRSGLLFNVRNHWGRGGFPDKSGSRLVARSFDGGTTWTDEKMDPALPEPPCQASIYRYSFPAKDEPGYILFANPAGRGRSNLRVRLSLDEGLTWPVSKLLARGSAAYSCMARLPDGRVGIVFERNNYKQISFATFSLDWLMQ